MRKFFDKIFFRAKKSIYLGPTRLVKIYLNLENQGYVLKWHFMTYAIWHTGCPKKTYTENLGFLQKLMVTKPSKNILIQ